MLPPTVRSGTIVTGDRDITGEHVAQLHERFGADAGDWESGAVAYVCALNRIPCLIIRGISDIPGGSVEEQSAHFRQNVPEVMRRIWGILPDFLGQIDGRSCNHK